MKMKRLPAFLLVLALLLSACAGQTGPGPEETAPAAAPEPAPQEALGAAETISLDRETPGQKRAAPEEEPAEAGAADILSQPEEVGEADEPPETAGPGTDFASAWGDLQAANGGELPWDTLTPEQQALVHYPAFDKALVYWTAGGGSYHSVDWCYSLSRSKTILQGSLEEAQAAGKTDPCSKCVGH